MISEHFTLKSEVQIECADALGAINPVLRKASERVQREWKLAFGGRFAEPCCACPHFGWNIPTVGQVQSVAMKPFRSVWLNEKSLRGTELCATPCAAIP